MSAESSRWLRVFGSLVSVVGFAVILGWVMDWPAARSFVPRSAEANMNAGICLVLGGGGLLAWAMRSVFVVRSVGALLVLLTSSILLETLTGWPAGTNYLFWVQPDNAFLWATGRIAPHAALAFLLTGVVFVLTDTPWGTRRLWRTNAGFQLGMSLLPLLHYVVMVSAAGETMEIRNMAVPTALGLFLLGAGLYLHMGGTLVEKGPRVLAGAALALVISVAVFMVAGNAQLIEANRLVARAQESRATINNLVSRVARMESTARAYVLTGQEGFGDRVAVHAQGLQQQLGALAVLIQGAPRQQERLAEMQGLAARKIADTTEMVEISRQKGMVAAAEFLAALPPARTSRLVVLADEMLAEEDVGHQRSLRMQTVLETNVRTILGLGGLIVATLMAATTALSIRATNARMQAERKLTDANRLQRAVLDGTVLSIIATEPDGVIREFNAGAEHMLGYKREEMVGQHTPEVIHVAGEMAARAIELSALLGRRIEPGFETFVAIARQGRADEREWTYVRKDGVRVPVRLSVTALRDGAGVITGFLGVAQDLSVQQQAALALRRSEDRLQQVLGHADCLVWEAQVTISQEDWDWRFTVHPSGMFHRLFGEKHAGQAGLWYQFDIPERDEMNTRSREAMLGGADGYVQEFRILRLGQTTWIRESVSILRTDPRHYWLVGVATDVTRLRTMTAALEQSEERFRNAFDYAGVGMALMGLDGRWLQTNRMLQLMLGYSDEELQQRTFRDVTHPEDLESDLANVQDLLAGRRRHYQMEKRYVHKEGRLVHARLTGSLVRDPGGAPLHFIAQIEDITARYLAEQAVIASQRQLTDVFRSMAEGLVLHDPLGKIIECNAAAENILGLSRAQLMGLTSFDPRWECINEDGSPCPPERHPAVITRMTGQNQRGVVMGVRKPDGSVNWLSVNSEAILEEDGHLRAVVVSFADVTERKQVEIKLREALTEAQRFREAQDNIPSFVYMKDTESRYIYANRPTLELFKCTAADLVGSLDERFFSLETALELREIDRQVLAGKVSNREIATKDADGKPRYYWEIKTPIFADPEHRVICGLLGISTDITERKQVAEALAESEERTRLFAEHAPASVAMFDREMRYLVHSAKWLKDYGLSGEHIIGRSHYEVFPEIGESWKEVHRRCLAGAIEINEADPFERADGHRQWLSWRVQPWRNAAGEIGGIVMFTEDITHRKELENKLAAARDHALAASKMKSEFLANVSHEIRTPMNGVLGMADLLMDTRLTEDQQQMARVIQSSAQNLLKLIDDLLDFSKIEAGKFSITTDAFSLAEQVDQALALMAPRAVSGQISLESDLPPDLPTRLWGDAGRIQQVLVNLLGNAVKFTEKGRVTVAIRPLAPSSAGSYAFRAEVRDTGIGISDEQQARLFQPFVQADGSTTRRFGGTGLGLAISRQLIELMSGRIGCESETGRGSVFWFELELPFAAAPAAARNTASQAPLSQSGARILVAEDQQANQLVMRLLLTKLGLEHTIVGDGQAAIEKLSSEDYALVLMDCQMPRIDGYEATRLIRAGAAGPDRQATPIVALTAHAMASDREKCLEAGMDDYLSKPIRLDALQAILQRLGIHFVPAATEPVNPIHPAATAVLDPGQLAQLRSLPGRTHASLLEELAGMALLDMPVTLAQLSRQVKEELGAEVVQTAHRLAGAAANLGALGLRTALLGIEHAAETADWPAALRGLADLDREWSLVQQALNDLLPKSPP